MATIGPASRDRAVLERLIAAGVNVVRLNFSHGAHEEHLAVMKAVREISASLGRPIALLQDLSGPKIRTGKVAGGRRRAAQDGARLVITTDESVEGTAERISTTYDPLPRDVAAGDKILLDDGNLELKVVATAGTEVECVVVHGGHAQLPQGDEPAGRAALDPRPDREGPARPGLRRRQRRRLRGALLRAEGRRRGGGQGAHPVPRGRRSR